MADCVLAFLKLIPNIKKMMLRLKWESIHEVEHIKSPILYITGD